jgi:large conductance mechanosensitive channel
MSLAKEFKAFALKGNVVDLAVAVVIGGAFGKIVTALVTDLIMPLVGAILPGEEWRNFTATPLHLKVGDLLGAVVDFFIIALVLFLVVVKLMGALKLQNEKLVAVATTKACAECLENIPLAAKRCRACTAVQQQAA